MLTRFEPPADVGAIVARPARTWSEDERARVVEWLYEPPRLRLLFVIILRALGRPASPEDAEDLLMEFLLRALQPPHGFFFSYDPDDKRPPHIAFRSSLILELRRFAWSESHASARRRAHEVSVRRIPEPSRDRLKPEKLAPEVEARELLALVREALSPSERLIVSQRLFTDKTYEEIAAQQRISTVAARVRYHRALVKIRELAASPRALLRWRDRLLLARSWGGIPAATPPDGDSIACTVFGRAVARKERCLIQVYAHMFDETAEAFRMALEFDEAAARLGTKSLALAISAGTQLAFVLALPGLAIDDPIQSLTWNRRTEAVTFGVDVPDDCGPGVFIGTVTVSANGIPAGLIKFRLKV
ncbi:MAG TPA: sigma factor-like helix-turn-helix DNA-binding protein, partial [Anaerolineales bacterium]